MPVVAKFDHAAPAARSDRAFWRRRRGGLVGFTLVELLVVIGIIAVMISILLPTLNKARESAKRTVCLAQLRSIGQMLAMYAAANHDQVPIGYSGSNNSKVAEGNNYDLTRSAGKTGIPDPDPPKKVRYVGLGLLVKANFVKNDEVIAKTFYCLSFQSDLYHYWDSPQNAWPPATLATGDGSQCRTTYSCRGSTNNIHPVPGSFATDAVCWASSKGPFAPCKVVNGHTDANLPPKSNNEYGIAPMFKLSKLKNRAVVADVVSSPTRTIIAHKDGINVLYADGSAKWVHQSVIKRQFNLFADGTYNAFDPSGDFLADQIWNCLDADAALYADPLNP